MFGTRSSGSTVTVTVSSWDSPSPSVTRSVNDSVVSSPRSANAVNVGDAAAASDRVTAGVPVCVHA